MNNRIDAVYARQSVDKADSISIESQIEFCKYELRGGCCKEYIDKGYSGKNTDRPQFQQLAKDIESGLISRVIVYKLDRISRSILDFSNMMGMFQKHNVEFVSSTEKFDTSTPMGRAMLNICIVFAQLERETIQKRVVDTFYSRCQKSFFMGGSVAHGFRTEETVLNGVHTKKLTPHPEEAGYVKLMYEMYAQPGTTSGDITRHFAAHGYKLKGRELTRCTLGLILRNPTYAQADLELYEFFKSQGAVIVNDAADFTGENGCYFYTGQNAQIRKQQEIKGNILVLAPHEGIVPSELWLKCRRKIMTNSYVGGSKPKHTWLAGKIKCGNCGYALRYTRNREGKQYLRCTRHFDTGSCPGGGKIYADEMEDFIYAEMVEKLREFRTLTRRKKNAVINPKLTALKVELAQVESEIGKLLDTLTGANAVLISYVNEKISELDRRRQGLAKAIAELSADAVSPEQLEMISSYLDDWSNVGFEDRMQVADGLITRIKATSEKVEIEWKI